MIDNNVEVIIVKIGGIEQKLLDKILFLAEWYGWKKVDCGGSRQPLKKISEISKTGLLVFNIKQNNEKSFSSLQIGQFWYLGNLDSSKHLTFDLNEKPSWRVVDQIEEYLSVNYDEKRIKDI